MNVPNNYPMPPAPMQPTPAAPAPSVMKAYRIQNDIVAAADEQAAIADWAEFTGSQTSEAGPLEEVPLTFEISIEEEDETWRDGTLEEVMPAAGSPAEVVAQGECDRC